jgi:hypothetical protein
MNFNGQIEKRGVYRVTGTPENFLTALRSLTWGFNSNPRLKNEWKKLLPGDIVFFHSKIGGSLFQAAWRSCVIGFGVVGNQFFESNEKLWIDEEQPGISYPYRFKLSEVYLYADISVNDDWSADTFEKKEATIRIINKVLDAGIPLSELKDFPHMGSFSAIANQKVKEKLFAFDKSLVLYSAGSTANANTPVANLLSKNKPIKGKERIAQEFSEVKEIKKVIIKKIPIYFTINKDANNVANEKHYDILVFLKSFFEKKGYRVDSNKFVDFMAHNRDTMFLIEAKSVHDENNRDQVRKAIAQVLEYDYYEGRKFREDAKTEFKEVFKVIVTSAMPTDKGYLEFVNSLDIKVVAVENGVFTGDDEFIEKYLS